MHLRKLARAMPLMLAAMTVGTTAGAQSPGSFLEGARVVTLSHPETEGPVTRSASHHPRDGRVEPRKTKAGAEPAPSSEPDPVIVLPAAAAVATTATAAVKASGADEAASFELRNLLTLVGALALVGWLQRRRPD